MIENNIKLTPSQQRAYDELCRFVGDSEQRVFILKGYAGTGKTTLMKRFVEMLDQSGKGYSLLASTGRAAKILSNVTGYKTSTVHGLIYKFSGLNCDLDKLTEKKEKEGVLEGQQLLLNFEMQAEEEHQEMFFLIDEASMVGDKEQKVLTQAIFGSGRLLRDLFDCYPNGKFIFIGDPCQLPPIGQSISPALSADYIEDTFDMKTRSIELTDIVRQDKGNDLVLSAQRMRGLYSNPPDVKWAKFPMKGYRNIHVLSSQAQLLNHYVNDIKTNGLNCATMLAFTNKQCDELTRLIRPSLGLNKPSLSVGDLLLITQNNIISGLMNGDLVVVKSLGSVDRMAGLHFQMVTVEELFTKKTVEQLMILEVLNENETNLTQDQQRELLLDFYYRMKAKGIKQKSKAFNDEMQKDMYLNALRAVYGFALTCHKAQGGEWERVYLDIPRSMPAQKKPYVYQWMYTAMTRARKELYVVDDFWLV